MEKPPNDDERLARLLEGISDSPPGATDLPEIHGLNKLESLALADELLTRGWIHANATNRGDGRLLDIRTPRVTSAGQSALEELRASISIAASTGQAETLPIQERQNRRLQVARRLYDETGGSPLKALDFQSFCADFPWGPAETSEMIHYLDEEGLLRFPQFGAISLTHGGVVEVERTMREPDKPTEHFTPAVNVNIIGQMHQSQIQQSTSNSDQQLLFDSQNVETVHQLIAEARDVLGSIEMDAGARSDIEAELGTASSQLGSRKPRAHVIQDSLRTVATLLGSAVAVANRTGQLVEYLDKLHRFLASVT